MASERVTLAYGDAKQLSMLRRAMLRGHWTHAYRDDPELGVHVGEILTDTLQVRKGRLTGRVEWVKQALYALPPQDEQQAVVEGLDAALEQAQGGGDGTGDATGSDVP